MKLPHLPFNFEPRTVAAHQAMAEALFQGDQRHAPTDFSTLDEITRRKELARVPSTPRIVLRTRR